LLPRDDHLTWDLVPNKAMQELLQTATPAQKQQAEVEEMRCSLCNGSLLF
jgi:hypothetical protein